MPYEFQSRVRFSEVGEDHKLTPAGVVDYFQDCSTFQSEELGNGLCLLEERGKAWILAGWDIVIERLPMLGECVTAQTWPTSMKGFFAERNFCLLGADGETLAYANSLWIYLDAKTGHPAKVDDDVAGLYVLEPALAMGRMRRKISVPEGSDARAPFTVAKSALDTNHHVNNGRYIAMALEYLPENFEVHGIRVEYRRSAKRHDVIVPLVGFADGKCTVCLCDTERSPYAVMEFRTVK